MCEECGYCGHTTRSMFTGKRVCDDCRNEEEELFGADNDDDNEEWRHQE